MGRPLVGGVFGLVRALPSAPDGRVDTRERLWSALLRSSCRARLAESVARVGLAAGSLLLAWAAVRGVT